MAYGNTLPVVPLLPGQFCSSLWKNCSPSTCKVIKVKMFRSRNKAWQVKLTFRTELLIISDHCLFFTDFRFAANFFTGEVWAVFCCHTVHKMSRNPPGPLSSAVASASRSGCFCWEVLTWLPQWDGDSFGDLLRCDQSSVQKYVSGNIWSNKRNKQWLNVAFILDQRQFYLVLRENAIAKHFRWMYVVCYETFYWDDCFSGLSFSETSDVAFLVNVPWLNKIQMI